MDATTPDLPEDEPELIMSQLCTYVSDVDDGPGVHIDIYTIAGKEDQWTLEVVNDDRTSYVFNDQFATEREALNAALEILEQEGMEAFYTDAEEE